MVEPQATNVFTCVRLRDELLVRIREIMKTGEADLNLKAQFELDLDNGKYVPTCGV